MNRVPPEIVQFEGLAESALAVWDPGASIILLKPLSGFSGAAVYKADISGGKSLQPGQYIIKLLAVSEWGEADEHSRHEQVTASNADFAKRHIPALVRHFVRAPTDPRGQRLAALLYHVAGQSLDRLVTIDSPGLDLSGLTSVCRAAFSEVLFAWRTGEVSYSDYHRALLRDWLGYRLLPTEGQSLRHFV